MNVLITGATGFVGSHLADYLVKNENIKLYGLKRWHLSKMRNIAHLGGKIQLVDCDLTDPIGIRKIIKNIRPDLVFHLAAESFVSTSWDHPSHYMDVNFNGTVNLLEAIRQSDLDSRILIAGSGEEYGEVDESDIPITETTTLKPVNPYAVTKIAQDLIGYVYHKSYGLNVIRTRAFNHEGPRRDNVFGIPWYAYQIAMIESKKIEPIIRTGNTDDRRNFTHVNDLIEAYWLAIQKCNPGELYLIGNDSAQSIHTFKEALNDLISMSSVQNIKTVVDPEFIRPTKVPRLIGNTKKFTDLTGWQPKIPYMKILEDTLEYWRDFVRKGNY